MKRLNLKWKLCYLATLKKIVNKKFYFKIKTKKF